MKEVKAAGNILEKIQKDICSKAFREKYFSSDNKNFSRKRKMPLDKLIRFLMEQSTKSYDIKLSDWLEVNEESELAELSKQAVSKGRQKLPVEIFRDIFQHSAEHFQKEVKNKKMWRGYQILAIDGTTVQIPTTEETLAYFGEIGTRYEKPISLAAASAIYDVINGVMLSSVIRPYRTAEREMAKELIETVIPIIEKENTIVLFDRGYPGYEFLEYLTDRGITYVIRVKKQMSRLRSEGNREGEVYRKCGKKCRTIRTLEIELEGGEEKQEYLITNIPKERVSYHSFEELYQMRWGIEGKYREIKCQLELEAFSGKKPICIEQDYYIAMFLSNISGLIKNTVDEKLEKENKGRTEYQANRGYIIHELNRMLSRMLGKKLDIEETIEKIIKKSEKKRSQIRRNRKCERNKNLNRRKYSMTYKSCI